MEDKQVKLIHVDASKIVDEDGNPIDLTSASALRRWLIKQYNGREVVVSDNGRIIRFKKKGLMDSIKRRGTEQRQVYADLDNLLENSVYSGFEVGDKWHPHIDKQEIYYSAAKIADKVFGIRFKTDIKKGETQGTYKDHKVAEIDRVEEMDTKIPPSPCLGLSPSGIEGGESIPASKIRAAMGLANNVDTKKPPSPCRGVDSPRGIEGGETIPASKIRAAMGLSINIDDSVEKVNSKNKKS